MAELLPYILPKDIQDAALTEFDFDPAAQRHAQLAPPAVQAAKEWLAGVIKIHRPSAGDPLLITAEYEICAIGGTNTNADVHIDSHLPYGFGKFILTICDVPDASTIFFPNDNDYDFGRRRSTAEWFERDDNHALHRIPYDRSIDYIQGQNGQVALFHAHTDLHGAPPLPKGAKKILLNHKVRLT